MTYQDIKEFLQLGFIRRNNREVKIDKVVNGGVSYVNCYENDILQIVIEIYENLNTIEAKKFKQRKYVWFIEYYLENGIENLSYNNIKSMLKPAGGRGCFLQVLFPKNCTPSSLKLHEEIPHYCIPSGSRFRHRRGAVAGILCF